MSPPDPLGERMKSYEAAANTAGVLDNKLPLVARIDGKSFSTFTRPFKKPFDLRLHRAMRRTMGDLVTHFHAATGYTQSDEITLIWPEVDTEKGQCHAFNGRVVKFATVLAGFTSVRFAYHLSRENFDDKPRLKEAVKNPMMHFDARVFNVPNRTEAVWNVLWRHRMDCRRNAVQNLFDFCGKFKKNDSYKLNSAEKIAKMAEHGVNYDDMPAAYRFGVFAKRLPYPFTATNPKTGEQVVTTRTRSVFRSFPLTEYSEAAESLLLGKYWETEEAQPMFKNVENCAELRNLDEEDLADAMSSSAATSAALAGVPADENSDAVAEAVAEAEVEAATA